MFCKEALDNYTTCWISQAQSRNRVTKFWQILPKQQGLINFKVPVSSSEFTQDVVLMFSAMNVPFDKAEHPKWIELLNYFSNCIQ